MAQTLYDKLWQSHVVHTAEDGTTILYIDRHLVHEVTSPQAFEGLKLAGRKPWRIAANLAVADHNVPTTHRAEGIADPISRLQVETLDDNAREYGLTYFNMRDKRQGIVHVIGPEQGATLPGMIAVDDTTINYVKGRPFSPVGPHWEQAVTYWRTLHSDTDAKFDAVVLIDAADISPQVTWGTSPEMVVAVDDRVPDPDKEKDPVKRDAIEKALVYMGLKPNTAINDIRIDKVFIGSCTNSRIEDLRAAAAVVRGKFRASNVKLAMVVPGSGLVKEQAEREGLDKIFRDAGFEWREPGCSMCLAMNADRLEPGERCASTSNRNFEGRQGAGGRTHLVSPAMAAAAGVVGHFVDVRQL